MYSFEEKYEDVKSVIQKYSNRWRLDAIHWLSFEDVSSEIETHVWKQWNKWDQSRPIEPWVARICQNQILNKLRNNYGNFARPCVKCPNVLDGTHCSVTSNHEQCSECPIYKAWMDSGKKMKHDIKMPLELENHSVEINNLPSEDIDYEKSIGRFRVELATKMKAETFVAFEMLCFEHKSDKEVAAFLGFKNKTGNSIIKQMQEFKTQLYKQIKNLLKESDVTEFFGR